MQSYAPPERKKKRKSKSASVNLTIIFNHNYARNIRHLDDVYCDRFNRVSYMLPNVAPKSERCFSFPVDPTRIIRSSFRRLSACFTSIAEISQIGIFSFTMMCIFIGTFLRIIWIRSSRSRINLHARITETVLLGAGITILAGLGIVACSTN